MFIWEQRSKVWIHLFAVDTRTSHERIICILLTWSDLWLAELACDNRKYLSIPESTGWSSIAVEDTAYIETKL